MLSRHNVKASFFAPVEAVVRQELLWHDRLGFAILNLLNAEHDGRERLMRTALMRTLRQLKLYETLTMLFTIFVQNSG